MLEKLAGRNTSDMTEWEIRGQGIEVLEKSREKYGVAVELKAYAIAQRPTDISGALAKLPESVSLDDFLDRLMPNTAKSDRRERLLRFFAHECDERVDDQMELHPRNLTRDETISAMALSKLEDYEHADLSQQSQYWLHDGFMTWWKTQDSGNNLLDTNEQRKIGKAEKLSKMLDILTITNRACDGMTSKAWEKQVALVLGVREGSFRRY